MIVAFETYNMCTFFLLVNAIASFAKPLMFDILLFFYCFQYCLHIILFFLKVSYKFKIIVYKFKLLGSSLYIFRL
jgi:hypothetical protein